MADIALDRPQPGQRIDVTGATDDRLVLNFPAGDPLLERVEDALVFTFEDGGSIAIDNFYTEYTSENMPDFLVDGEIIPGDQFFAAMGEALMPAAGPAAGAAQAARNARYNTYDDADLLGGISRLDGLDISNQWGQQPEETLYGTPDAGPNFTPEFGLALSVLDVDVREAGVQGNDVQLLSSGGDANTAYGGVPTASGQVVATDRNPGDTLSFSITAAGSTVIDIAATNTPQTITTQYGTITINNDGTYSYSLSNVGNANALAQGQTVSETFTVTVTDNRGASASTDITVNITGTNDRPELTVTRGAGNDAVKEDGSTSVTGSYAGADVDSDDTPGILDYRIEGSNSGTPHTQEGTYGTLTLSANGTYTYELFGAGHPKANNVQALAEGQQVTESFDVTVIDSHTSTDTKPVVFTITGTNDVPVINVEMSNLEVSVREAGVKGDDATLPGDANTPYDGVPTASGKIVATDMDATDTLTFSVDNNAGLYGTLTIDDNGNYVYTLDQDKSDVLNQDDAYTDQFLVTVTDNHGGSDNITIYVSVNGTNERPVLTLDGGINPKWALTEADTGVIKIDGTYQTVDKDADGTEQSYTIAGVGVTNGTATPGNTGTNTPATFDTDYGTLTLNMDGTYNYVLKNGTNTAVDKLGAGETYIETFAVTTTDTHGSSHTQNITLTITGSNDDPVVDDHTGSLSLKEDGVQPNGNLPEAGILSVIGTVEAHDVDANDTLHYNLTGADAQTDGNIVSNSTDPNTGVQTIVTTYGTLVLNPNGATPSYTYTLSQGDADKLNQGQEHTETFTLTVTDDHGGSQTVTIDVKIEGTNDQPQLTMTGTTAHALIEDQGALSIQGQFTVGDVDQDGAWKTGEANANHKYSIDGGTGTASNGNLGESSSFATQYGTLTVNPDGTYSYALTTGTGTALDKLGEGQTHTETFNITVTDIHGANHTKTITVELTGTNDDPTIINGAGTLNVKELGVKNGGNTAEPGTPNASSSFTVTDVDSGDHQTVTLLDANDQTVNLTTGAGGVLSYIDAYGTLTITPTTNSAGVITYTYKYTLDNTKANSLDQGDQVSHNYKIVVTDDHGSSVTENVTVNIEGTNDKPSVSATALTVKESGVFGGNVMTNETTTSSPGDAQHKGFATGKLTGTDADADADLSYSISLATGTISNEVDGTTQTIVTEFGTMVLNTVTGSYTFTLDATAGGAADKLGYGVNETLTFNGKVVDEHGAYSTVNFKITIKGTNDVPELTLGTPTLVVKEDATFQATGNASNTDIDTSDTHTYGLTARDAASTSTAGPTDVTTQIQGQYGVLLIDKTTGKYTYTLNQNGSDAVQGLHEGEMLFENFHVIVTDKNGAFDIKDLNVTIQGTDDAPIFSTGVTVADVTEAGVGTPYGNAENVGNASFEGSVKATDKDSGDTEKLEYYFKDGNGELVTTITTAYGTIEIDPTTGKFTYTLDNDADAVNTLKAGDNAQDTFTVVVTDSGGLSTEQPLNVNIHGTNDKPIIDSTGDAQFTEDSGTYTASGVVTAHDLDLPDGKSLSYSLVDGADKNVQFIQGQYGYLTLDEVSGEYTYHLDNSTVQGLGVGVSITENFPVRVTDNLNASEKSTITITITGSDDKPSMGATNSLTEDSPSVNGTIVWSDPDKGDMAGNDADVLQGYKWNGNPDAVLDTNGDTITVQGQYGTIDINLVTGAYTYHLDTSTTQHLNIDRDASESFPLTVTTGNSHGSSSSNGSIDIKIIGTNDAPTFVVNGDITAGDAPITMDDLLDANEFISKGQLDGVDIDNKDLNDAGVTAGNSELRFGFDTGAQDAHGEPYLNPAMVGQYGTLIVNQVTGEYQYVVNKYSNALQTGEGPYTEEFTVTVSDPHGGTDTVKITIEVAGDIIINGPGTHTYPNDVELEVEEDHKVVDDGTITNSDQPYSIAILDGDGNLIDRVQSVTDEYGTLVVDAQTGICTYYLNNGSATVQSMTEGETETQAYTIINRYPVNGEHINEGANPGDDSAKVTVTITGDNDVPVITSTHNHHMTQGNKGEGEADMPHPEVTGTVIVHDIDKPDTQTFSLVNGKDEVLTITTEYGTITIDPTTGKYNYTLTTGTDLTADDKVYESFKVMVKDSEGASSESTIAVTITGTNNQPELTVTNVTVTEDGMVAGTGTVIGAGEAKADDDTGGLRFGASTTENAGMSTVVAGKYGTLFLNAGTGEYEYRLNNALEEIQGLGTGEKFEDVFYVTVTDKHGATDTQQLTVTVEGTNDTPILFVDSTLKVTEAALNNVVEGTARATDKDASDDLTYGVKDGLNGDNGHKVIDNAYGKFEIDPATGKYTFTLNNDSAAVKALALGEVHELKYTVQVTDGTEIVSRDVTISVIGTNSTPEVTIQPVHTLTEDSASYVATGTVSATDADHGAALQYSFANGSQRMETAYGTIVLNPTNGTYTYTLKNDSAEVQKLGADDTHHDTFTVVVKDEHGISTTTEMDITIKGTNDVPVITSAAPILAVTEDGTLSQGGTIVATDVDATDNLTYLGKLQGSGEDFASSVDGTYGKLVLQPNGGYTYTLDNDSAAVQALSAGQTKTEKFTVQVNDGHGGTVEQTITVNVTGTNDLPVATLTQTDSSAAIGGDTASGSITFTDVDLGDVHSIRVGGQALTGNSYTGTYGTIVFTKETESSGGTNEGTFSYTYTLNPSKDIRLGETATETIKVTVWDGNGKSTEQEIIITVTGTNAAPVITLNNGSETSHTLNAVLGAEIMTGALSTADADSSNLTYSLSHDDGNPATPSSGGVINLQGNYGTLVLDTADGSYTYTVDTANADVLTLAKNDPALTDTFTYTVSDGLGNPVAQPLTFTIDSNSNVITADTPGELQGTDGADRMFAHVEGSSLFGDSGNDMLFGGIGDDILFGGSGNDVLFGGDGNDYLNGGDGANQLYGGDGNDILMFSSFNTAMEGGAGIDFMVGADIDSLDDLLDSGIIQGVEVFVTQSPSDLSLTSLTDFEAIGVTVDNGMVSLDSDAWTQVVDGDVTLNNVDYVEYTRGSEEDTTTLLVQKTLLENNQS